MNGTHTNLPAGRLGQIGLIPHATDKIGQLIEWATLSDVHHTIIDVGNGQVLDVMGPRIKLSPATNYPNAIWSYFPLTATQAIDVAEWARLQIGRRYNYAALVLVGIHDIIGLPYVSALTAAVSHDGALDCSQTADAALTQAGYQVFNDGRQPGIVSPGDFEQLYKLNGWWPTDFQPTPRAPGIRGLASIIWPEPPKPALKINPARPTP